MCIMVSISSSVCAIQILSLLRSFCMHDEVCTKVLCSEKELLNLKDSKLCQNCYGNKTGFVRPGHIYGRSADTSLAEIH